MNYVELSENCASRDISMLGGLVMLHIMLQSITLGGHIKNNQCKSKL